VLKPSLLACLSALALAAPPAGAGGAPPVRLPRQLAFYYGWPSLVNGAAGDIALATRTFLDYRLVVFGNGLDDPAHGDHERTRAIMANLRAGGTRVYGYVDLCALGGPFCSNLSLPEIQARVDRWAAMGAAGIFLDQAGYDFAVSRERLNRTVSYIHARRLSAFVNPWDPDDVFSPAVHPTLNPTGATTRLGPADYCLHESFAVTLSTYQDPAFLVAKSEKGLRWKRRYGTRMATVNTVAADNPPFDPAQLAYVWWTTLLYGFDAMAWGETAFFSAETSTLPLRARPAPTGLGESVLPLAVSHRGSVHRRATTTGTIQVNTATHLGQFIPGPPPPIDNAVTQPGSQATDLIGGDAEIAPERVVVRLRSNGAPIDAYRLLLDTDVSAATGFLHSANLGLGSEYLVENGSLYRFTGATQTEWSWAFLGPVSAEGVGTAEVAVTVPAAAIGLAAGAELALLGEHFDPATFVPHDVLLRAGVWVVAP
jgi:hypothetical protein